MNLPRGVLGNGPISIDKRSIHRCSYTHVTYRSFCRFLGNFIHLTRMTFLYPDPDLYISSHFIPMKQFPYFFFHLSFCCLNVQTLESRASVEILLHARDGVTIVGSKYNCHLLRCTLRTNCYLSIQWNSIHWSNIYKQDWYLLLELHLVDDLLSLHYKVILNLDHFVTTLAYL